MPVTAVLAIITISILIPIAHKAGWVDQPGHRKTHEQATPVVGGLGIFIAWFVVLTLTSGSLHVTDNPMVWLGLSAMLLLVVGAADDMKNLSAFLRFLLQACAALLMIGPAGTSLTDFGELFSSSVLQLGLLSVPITVFAAVGVINAFNMIDGMDGLAGTIFLVAVVPVTLFAAVKGNTESLRVLVPLIGAVAGFLLLNARFPWISKAKVFLGNSGSMMLGFFLAWFLIDLGNGSDRVFMPMTAVWLFAVPLLDTSTLIYSRWRSGQSAFEADNQHLHHAFLRAGFSVEATWLAITTLAIFFASVGIILEVSPLPDYFSFYIFMIFAFTYYFYLRHCWAAQKFLGRHFIHHDFTVDEK